MKRITPFKRAGSYSQLETALRKGKIIKSSWTIDSRTGHCSHPIGLVTYFDFVPTPSGAIRCIGPFVLGQSSDEAISRALRELCNLLEHSGIQRDAYVVFGAYTDEAEFAEHTFPILGSYCGFIPCLGIRAHLFEQDCQWTTEWVSVGSTYAAHKSGLCFGGENAHDPDLSVVHPLTISTDITTLTTNLRRRKVELDDGRRDISQPMIWTPLRAAS